MFKRQKSATDRHVENIRDCIANGVGNDLLASLNAVVEGELWRQIHSETGDAFESIADFAIERAPRGLEIRTVPQARLVRQGLLMLGHVGAWVTIMAGLVRPSGRPPKTFSQSEGFRPFYPVPTSQTAADRILLNLRRAGREDLLAEIGAARLSFKEAGIKGGVVPQTPDSHELAYSMEKVRATSVKAQSRTLRDHFRVVDVEAQCSFIASELQPYLGMDLAQRWRAHSRSARNPSSEASESTHRTHS